jgi:NADH-quinone oxidoreductase subunit H
VSVWDYIVNLIPNLVRNLNSAVAGWPGWVAYLVVGLAGVLALVAFVMPQTPVLVWVERRLVARAQVRMGPNRTGPFGLLQTIADALKLITKEVIVPANADGLLHLLASALVFVPAFMMFAVIPFSAGGVFTNLNMGLVYLIAVGSLGAVLVFTAGFSSANRYAMLGAARAVAQLLSYEVPATIALATVAVAAGTLSLPGIVQAQTVPYALYFPLALILFICCSLVEVNRAPADLAEAESEIIAGYHIEYGGFKWACFQLAEYTHMVAGAAIIATLFLSGWKGPGLPPYIWLYLKMLAVIFTYMLIRFTLPRIRVDQIMGFAWKFLLPLSIVNILVVGLEVVMAPSLPVWLIAINVPFAVVSIVTWAKIYRLIEGPPRPVQRRELPGITAPLPAETPAGAAR